MLDETRQTVGQSAACKFADRIAYSVVASASALVKQVAIAALTSSCSYCIASAPTSKATCPLSVEPNQHENAQLLTHCNKEHRLLVGRAACRDVSPTQVGVQASIVRHLRVRRLDVHLPAVRIHKLRRRSIMTSDRFLRHEKVGAPGRGINR